MIFSGFIISFIFIFFVPATKNFLPLIFRFYGLLFFAGIFLFLFLSSKGRWLGLGDVKLAALLGFTFGFEGAISIFFLTFFIGFVVAIMLLALKKAYFVDSSFISRKASSFSDNIGRLMEQKISEKLFAEIEKKLGKKAHKNSAV